MSQEKLNEATYENENDMDVDIDVVDMVNKHNDEIDNDSTIQAFHKSALDTSTPNKFCIRSKEGISINGVRFSRGIYTIGQLVGTITIDENIKNNLLSTDAKSIKSNPSSA